MEADDVSSNEDTSYDPNSSTTSHGPNSSVLVSDSEDVVSSDKKDANAKQATSTQRKHKVYKKRKGQFSTKKKKKTKSTSLSHDSGPTSGDDIVDGPGPSQTKKKRKVGQVGSRSTLKCLTPTAHQSVGGQEIASQSTVEVTNLTVEPRSDLGTQSSQRTTPDAKVSVGYPITDADYFSICDLFDDEEEGDADETNIIEDCPEFSTQPKTAEGEENLLEPADMQLNIDVSVLAKKLTDVLKKNSWIVDTSGHNMCRLSLHGATANVVVQKSVCWRNGQIEVYIHNQPLPEDSFLWGRRLSEPSNLQETVDYLWRFSFILSCMYECSGIVQYEDYWSGAVANGRGFIESELYGQRCFRSAACSLAILESGCCDSCKEQKESFRKRNWKATHSKGSDKKKITNASMSSESLKSKLSTLQKTSKAQKKKIRKLEERIKKMVEEDRMYIDEHLGSDFTKILKENAHKMSGIQKLFWKEQMKAFSREKNPRSMRWNPMMVKIALHLQKISPSAFRYLRDAGFIKLPSERTLYDFTHFVDNKEGVQTEILSLIEKKLNDMSIPNDQRYFNLLFDEIHIKSDLVRNKHGEVIGYVNLTDVEKTLTDLESNINEVEFRKPALAKKVLAYMLQGLGVQVHDIVGIFSTTDLTSTQLYVRTWEMVYQLEARNIKILCFICDGAASNKKFFNMHVKWDLSEEFIYATRNLYADNRPIFFMVDPPHLLKTLRNCLSNSHAHYCSRNMWKNGKDLSWQAFVKLYEETVGSSFKIHKLTKAHVALTSFSRMRVSLATQLFSNSTGDSFERHRDDEAFINLISDELIEFVRICNRFFDCLNGSDDAHGSRNKVNSDLHPYTKSDDERFSFLYSVLKYFQTWKEEVMKREGHFSLEERKRMQISRESYESLHITIHGFIGAVRFLLENSGIKSVSAKDFNQDKLEQEFGLFRMAEGSNNHPTLSNIIQRTLTQHVQRSAALPVSGNTKGKRKALSVDETPLPKKRNTNN